MKKKRIAMFQHILASKPVRGPMIFFPIFNSEYQNNSNTQFELYYLLRTDDVGALSKRFGSTTLGVKNIIILPERNHRFKKIVENLELIWHLFKLRVDLLYLANVDDTLEPAPALRVLQKLSSLWKIKKTYAVTYNGFPAAYNANYTGQFEGIKKYEAFFREIHLDGVYTWYDDVIDWIATCEMFKSKPIVRTIQSRFCDTKKYYPDEEKNKIIVWAGALVAYKRPEMLLQAIEAINNKRPTLLEGWKVIYSGSGNYSATLKELIAAKKIEHLIEVREASDNYHVLLNDATCMVSTQTLDHFPSLAINEAMASGCAIIATNVGRAHLFVKHGINGYLTTTDDAEGITNALILFLEQSDTGRQDMMQASRNECETTHTADNFIKQIDSFWNEVLAAK